MITRALCACLVGCLVMGGCSLPDPLADIPPPSQRLPALVSSSAPEPLPARTAAYHGERFRDPFVPLSGDASASLTSEGVIVPSLSSLALKGIIDDGRQMIALFTGGGYSYILRGKYFFDSRQRLVPGITGIIRSDNVVVIGPDKSLRTIKLRERNKQ